MSGAGQEVEAVAVGWPRGGEAQGRHSGGVSCEPLQDQQINSFGFSVHTSVRFSV